jgi:choloylglycine hydrolase
MKDIDMRSLKNIIFPSILALLFFCQTVGACTSFQLVAADGSRVYARTMEFQFPLYSDVVIMPRNFHFVATGPNNQPGASWDGKYGVVGMNGFSKPLVIDGLNEKGLAGGILYFPDHAVYTNPKDADAKKSMAPWEFMSWALMNFASVAQIKAALNDVSVINIVQPDLKVVPPFHYVFHDASGAVLVVEPIKGKLVAHDNPYGVMTNSPPFDWHVNNLGNYVKLSPVEPDPIKVFGQSVSPISTGAGFLGMPGDSTSPSRFIRALTYTSTITPAKSADENVRLAEHVLHNFDIPIGSIRTPINKKTFMELTQWSVISDLKNMRFYFSTYDYQPLRMVDLNRTNFDKSTPTFISLKSKYPIETLAAQ